MKNSIKMIFALLAFSAAGAFTISFVHQKTEDAIEANILEAKGRSLANVLSAGSTALLDSIDGFGDFWIEIDENGNAAGYAFVGTARGYSPGLIRFFCGIDLDGTIKGLSIISHEETPGLGARITEVISNVGFPFGLWQRSDDETPWFGEQFKGLSAVNVMDINRNSPEWHQLNEDERERLRQHNQITLITGSTITVREIKNELSARAKMLMALLEAKRPITASENIRADDSDDNLTEDEN